MPMLLFSTRSLAVALLTLVASVPSVRAQSSEALPPPLPAAPAVAPTSTAAKATTMLVDGKPVRLPGFRASGPIHLDGAVFAAPQAKEETDASTVAKTLRERIEGVRMDPVHGDAIRVDGQLVHAGQELEHSYAAPRRGATGETLSVTTRFRLVRVTPSAVHFAALDGTPVTVPLLVPGRSDGATGGAESSETDVIVGTGAVLHPAGYVLTTVLPRYRADKSQVPLVVHTQSGRFPLELVQEDRDHRVALWQMKMNHARPLLAYCPPSLSVSPAGTPLTAVFYQPGDEGRPGGIMSARARLPVVSSTGSLTLRGNSPAGVLLISRAGSLEGLTVRSPNPVAGQVEAVHLTALQSLLHRLPPIPPGAPGPLDSAVVAVAEPLAEILSELP